VRPLYIVDTNASVREGLSRLAGSAGFEPRAYKSIEAFLDQQAADGGGACAVIDLSDAGLRQGVIRERLATLAGKLPVIALSARDDAQTQRLARELGARAFFRKPVDAAALLDSIGWVSQPPKPR
jgi:FixJ family two-component response regulator